MNLLQIACCIIWEWGSWSLKSHSHMVAGCIKLGVLYCEADFKLFGWLLRIPVCSGLGRDFLAVKRKSGTCLGDIECGNFDISYYGVRLNYE